MKKPGFYQSAPWRKLAAQVKHQWKISGRPCAYCGQPLDWTARPIADHIQSRRNRPDLELDRSNVCVVHHQCNSKKAVHVDSNTRLPVNQDGFSGDWV